MACGIRCWTILNLIWRRRPRQGFAYGILKAVRKRYVGAEYAEVAEKAIRGIVKNISPEGELLQTSFGTGMGSDLEFYRQIPLTSMPYGQAMAILCLTEYLRKYF